MKIRLNSRVRILPKRSANELLSRPGSLDKVGIISVEQCVGVLRAAIPCINFRWKFSFQDFGKNFKRAGSEVLGVAEEIRNIKSTASCEERLNHCIPSFP